MKEKDEFILDIKRLGINGEGIGFYNKCAVFVNNAIPGEGHKVVVKESLKNMAYADSIEIKRQSNQRVQPKCPYYFECGGCNTSHISYDAMLKYKKEILKESLQRYTDLNIRTFEINDTVPSLNQQCYRNRSQLIVRQNKDNLNVCMLKAKTNQTIYIDNCLVQDPVINELNEKILRLAEKNNISAYIPKFNRGVLRYLVTRVNAKKEALVCLICGEKNLKIKALAKDIINIPNVVGVYESFNTSKKEGVFFTDEITLLEGKPYIIEELGNVKYRIYPNTFFQLNTNQAKNMYDLVLKACKLSRKETVLDAYCGVGSIGLYLAKMAKEVIGIEYNKDSVEAANENAKLNKITNAKFYQGDATHLLPKMIEEGIQIDCLVADPPRTGLTDEFINAVIAAKIKRVVYVSCNPASFAKDLQKLSEHYKVNYITPVDMFPQTALVECVAHLILKNSK